MPRIGYVVETHPGDYSVDLVMASDGARIVGAQVLTANGSTASGTTDLPHVQPTGSKWDISNLPKNPLKAVVDFVEGVPIVSGFLFPQTNQMLFDDPKRMLYRHQSDVIKTIDGNGNVQITHPSGAFIRIGETPEPEDLAGANADGGLGVDQNTERLPYAVLGLAGNKLRVTFTPEGNFVLEAEGTGTIKASELLLDTPLVRCTGRIESEGDQVAGGVSQINHEHSGVQRGPSNTDKPLQS